MRFPIPHIMAIVLLVHMGLGCCWHHAHVFNVCDFSAVSAVSATIPSDADSHMAHTHHGNQTHDCDAEHHSKCGPIGDTPSQNDDRCPGHSCEGDTCYFVQSNPRAVLFLLPGDALRLFSAAPLQAGMGPALVGVPRSQGDLFQAARLPVRAHLLLSILLI